MANESLEEAIRVTCPEHLRRCLRIASSMFKISERLRTSLLVRQSCHLILGLLESFKLFLVFSGSIYLTSKVEMTTARNIMKMFVVVEYALAEFSEGPVSGFHAMVDFSFACFGL